MKLLVYGAGAIGSAVGAVLARDHEVTLLCRPALVQAINDRGLRITGRREMVVPNIRGIMDLEGLAEQDVVLITTKAYNTAAAVEALRDLVTERTIVVSLQNGLDNIDIMGGAFGRNAVVGLTSIGITMLRPGEIFWAGEGETVLGSPHGETQRAAAIADIFNAAGLPSRTTPIIREEVWMKAVINACINPITALVGKENGSILDSPELTELSRNLCHEAVRAAEVNGMVLPAIDPWAKVQDVIERTRHNRSSMLQDRDRGRRTEIDEITGALVRRGEAKGERMPLNRAMWTLVRNAQTASAKD